MKQDETSAGTTKALHRLVEYMDGVLTESELISQLAELPREVITGLPDYPSTKSRSLRSRVLELQDAISRGETIKIGAVA